MTQIYTALLRGINVGGHKKILMKDLVFLFQNLGLTEVETYIQSGNIVFKSIENNLNILESKIHAGISATFGFDVPVLVRDSTEIKFVVTNNPFINEQQIESQFLHYAFIQNTVSEKLILDLKNPSINQDQFRINEKGIYIYCPDGFGKTKLTNTFFEQKLKTPITIRNWRTMMEVSKMMGIV